MAKSKERKIGNIKDLLWNNIGTQIVIIYVVIMLIDMIYKSMDDSFELFTIRSIVLIPLGFIVAFFTLKNILKKKYMFLKEDKNSIKSIIIVAQVVIFLIFVIYGFISVNSNLSQIKESSEYKMYEMFFSSDELETVFEEAIKEAGDEARKGWIQVAAIYTASAAVAIYLIIKKMELWLVDEIPDELLLANKDITEEKSEVENKEPEEVNENNDFNVIQ